jgi:hypothetical protein
MYIANVNKYGKWKNPSATKTYNSWSAMRSRCYRNNDKCFDLYGGRGIKVCERWLNNYDNFFEDMGDRPIGMSLDRIDNNGNYEKNNCRWVSMKKQQNNRRNNLFIEFKSKFYTISALAKKFKIPTDTLKSRIFVHKIPIEHALSKEKIKLPRHDTIERYNMGCRCLKCIDCKLFLDEFFKC